MKVHLHGGPFHLEEREVTPEEEEKREITLWHHTRGSCTYLFALPLTPGEQPRWIYDDFVDRLENASKGYT